MTPCRREGMLGLHEKVDREAAQGSSGTGESNRINASIKQESIYLGQTLTAAATWPLPGVMGGML